MEYTDAFERFANADASDIIKILKNKYKISASLESLDIESVNSANIHAQFNLNGNITGVDWEYAANDNNTVYMDKSIEELARALYSTTNRPVTSSTRSSIFGADEESDEFEDIEFDDSDNVIIDDDSIADNIDNMADKLDDLQETIDDIQQDDPNIDMDNNIDNHYIAECERCHGIFISAVVESDQKIDKISGTCPLCEKETDQYLRWVVKSVHDSEDYGTNEN